MRRIHDRIYRIEVCHISAFDQGVISSPPLEAKRARPRDLPILVPKSVLMNTFSVRSLFTFPTISYAWPTCRCASYHPTVSLCSPHPMLALSSRVIGLLRLLPFDDRVDLQAVGQGTVGSNTPYSTPPRPARPHRQSHDLLSTVPLSR